MRFRNTLLLILVLIGLATYVVNVERPAALKEATKEKLADFKTEDATELVLVYPDREIALAKSGNAWKITKPIDADADDVAVKGILSTLSTAEVKKGLDGEVKDLSVYGLEKPNTTVTVKIGDKTLPVVKIGETAPIGGSAYALRGDDKKILLTTAAVRSGVDKTLKDLRNKTILKFTDDSVRKIEVKSEGSDLVLAKSGEQWKIEAPAAHDADATTVRSYLSTLRSLRATDFPDETADPTTYGLVEPRLSVTLTLGDKGEQQTLLVGGGNDKKENYVKTASSPVVYTVGEWVGRDLIKPAYDFRDKSVVAFDKDKIKSVEVTRQDGSSYTLIRGDDGQWKLDKAEKPVPPPALLGFVTDLASLKGYEIAADGVTDLAAYGLDPAVERVKITGADGAEVGTLLLGEHQVDGKKEYTAARVGGGTVFRVRDYHFTRLNRAAGDLEKPAAPPAPPAGMMPGGAPPAMMPPGAMVEPDGGEMDEGADLGDEGDQPDADEQ